MDVCKDCRGTGWVPIHTNPETQQVTEVECSCQDEKRKYKQNKIRQAKEGQRPLWVQPGEIL